MKNIAYDLVATTLRNHIHFYVLLLLMNISTESVPNVMANELS